MYMHTCVHAEMVEIAAGERLRSGKQPALLGVEVISAVKP